MCSSALVLTEGSDVTLHSIISCFIKAMILQLLMIQNDIFAWGEGSYLVVKESNFAWPLFLCTNLMRLK